uniref:Peptidase S1 domain-containing protein n=1 Tax=Panagrellus redivivus TaxID=6233 RepID=A0A7E4V4Z9_PANRE
MDAVMFRASVVVALFCYCTAENVEPWHFPDDLLITPKECENANGTSYEGRCFINAPTPSPCPLSYMQTPRGCIGQYFDDSCALDNGMKENNLCVILRYEPSYEIMPGPQVLQTRYKNATIVPNAVYNATSNNGFKPLTTSENTYVQSVCGQAKYQQSRIVNGMLAAKGQFPWIIDVGICTGVLISPRHVLTAQHCVSSDPKSCRPNDGILVPSKYGGICNGYNSECPNGVDMKRVMVSRIIYPHDNPGSCLWGSDIALLLLEEDIEFNDYVKPICMSKLDPNNLINLKNVGFGQIENGGLSPHLRYINARISKVSSNVEIITEGMNNGNKSTAACFGDSGGPVQASFNGSSRTYLAGIHSRGALCDGEGKWIISTYIPAVADWICMLTGICEQNFMPY